MRIDSEGVFLRSYPYSVWFPVFLEEEQDTYPVNFTRVLLRTPQEFRSVFTGTWIEDRIENGMRISHWSADSVDLFDAQWTARRFELKREKGFFIYSKNDPLSMEMAGHVLDIAKSLDGYYRTHYRDAELGGQLHIMQMPRFGDISSGNVVGITDENWTTINEDPYATFTLAHEYVHPFVQARTPRSDPFYALMIEGFPSYFYLPALAEIHGEEIYSNTLKSWVEKGYLSKRRSGKDRRGRPLPEEKPLLEITPDEIRIYKDQFVLCDRALLLGNYLRSRLGKESFKELTLELFSREEMTRPVFEEVVLKYLPDAREDLRIWLTTTEYPKRLRL